MPAKTLRCYKRCSEAQVELKVDKVGFLGGAPLSAKMYAKKNGGLGGIVSSSEGVGG